MCVIDMLINDRHEPVDLEPGITPVLRWHMGDQPRHPHCHGGVSAYRVVVSLQADLAAIGVGDVWDSGRVKGDGLDGVALDVDMSPARRYWVNVRIWDGCGEAGGWAQPVTFGTGAGTNWQAQPIWIADRSNGIGEQRDDTQSELGNAAGWAFLRGAIDIPDQPIAWATLNATGASTTPARQFVYRMWLNGSFVGCGPVFPTGSETRYDGFDVTQLLQPGTQNVIGAIAYAMEDRRFAAQLDICFENGEMLHWGTGPDWLGFDGSRVYPPSASIGTQYFDAPAENLDSATFPFDFACAGFDTAVAAGVNDSDVFDAQWAPVAVKQPFALLEATAADKLEVRDERPENVTTNPTGDGIVIDFGKAWMGGIALSLNVDEPVDLTIRYGEVLEDDGSVRYHLSCFNTYEDVWHIVPEAAGRRLETWGIRVFRYVEIIPSRPIADLAERLVEQGGAVGAGGDGLVATALIEPLSSLSGGSDTSDDMVNRVWELSRHTIEAFNGNMYVDSWTRERAAYEADAWIQQRAHLALEDAPALGTLTVNRLIANRTWPTEWPLYLILAVHDAWLRTGSLEQARHEYAALASLLPSAYLDETTGLIVKDPGHSSRMDGDLVDWPMSERDGFVFGRVNTVINALASAAYAAMADLAKALADQERARHADAAGELGFDDDASRYEHIAARMREAIHHMLWDEERGVYIDGLDPVGSNPDQAYDEGVQAGSGPIAHASLHANAFVFAFAEVPAERAARVGDYLRSRGMACSVYVAAVYLDGLFRAGLGTDAVKLLAAKEGMRSWANMLASGGGGTMEAWDLSLKPNTTYSHPWAASPVYLLPEGVLGVRMIEAGFRRFAVIPQLGELTSARTVLPTRAGLIEVSCRVPQEGNEVELSLTVPPRTEATVVLPPVSSAQAGEKLSVDVDGRTESVQTLSASMRLAGTLCPAGAVVLEHVTSGHHVFRIQ
ncbi:family 78 glycoside hydrolase catalytic domain [Bifidobacterium oedipodis]|uniref:alpha-L-rhamnosidase n=1 Tax=Bifidobacterium oedipodis TaxID=2675322 RepID=A0A7Y0ENW3_9BIFI|nr:family 78 glycoside hydrolase catalytic domain [Bifidobacterium sp. DSM 109957]NMM93685.1 Bacterial alpha-L-rhamnosidase 6 hairpin glycosidase domain-containing protein [Bifidobacterium sp. DSM 109957]